LLSLSPPHRFDLTIQSLDPSLRAQHTDCASGIFSPELMIVAHVAEFAFPVTLSHCCLHQLVKGEATTFHPLRGG
jgi:hypothetical protein